MKKLIFNHFGEDVEVELEFTKFVNGQNALLLNTYNEEFECMEPYMVGSVALDLEIENNQILIKNYSENEGLLDFLIENNVVSKPLKYVRSGFVEIPLCELIINN